MPSDHRPQMLEVEDVGQRQKRLQDTLERLNGEGSSTGEPLNLSFDFGVRKTFPMEPPTELLARVRQFLPHIEQSNAELLQSDPRSIDIECIEDTDEHVIVMDLGLGVFEQRQARRHSNSSSSSGISIPRGKSRATRNSSPVPSALDSSVSSSSDSEVDDHDNRDGPSHRSRTIHRLPKRANPMIQVLASRDEGDSSAGNHLVS